MSEDRDQPVVRLSTGRTSSVTQAPGEDSPVASLRSSDRSTEALFGPRSMPRPATPGSLRETYETGVGQIGRAVGDIPRYAGGILSSFFTALKGGALTPRVTPPTREGWEAGGEFLSQAGDIGMAATGGGAVSGPIETPRQAGRMATGFGTPQPQGGVFDPLRRPPPPGPQLALPPPAIPPAAGMRALPPPSVDIPGRPIPTPGPAIETPGVAGQPTFRSATPEPFPRRVPGAETQPERDILARAPTGAIPRPGAVMSTVPGPQLGSPLSTAEQARLAGGLAGRDLPSRAPGTEGRPPSAHPLDDAHVGQPSQIASALVTNDASAIDRAVTKRFQRAASGAPRPQTMTQMETRDQNITTAVDSVIANKDNIQFRDPRDSTGNTLMRGGQLPRNLDEFVQAVDYLKGEIFKRYDQLSTRLGGQGVRVDLTPTIARLHQLGADPALEDITPTIQKEAFEMADRFQQRGSYSPQEAQNVIQSMNAQLRNFLQKKQTGEIFSHPTLINKVRDQLLTDLNSTMARALGGPQYQALRNQYASLASIEGNITNALVKQLEKPTGLLGGKKLTLAEMGGLIWGAVDLTQSGSGKILGITAATHLSRELQRFLTSPNFAVRRMFSSREASLQPSYTDVASARMASRFPSLPPAPPLPPPYVGSTGP